MKVQPGQVIVYGGRGTSEDIVTGQIAGPAEPPKLGEPVQQPAFAVDLLAAHVLVGLAQLLLEEGSWRVGRRTGQIKDRVVARQVEMAERTLVEVNFAQLSRTGRIGQPVPQVGLTVEYGRVVAGE